MIKLKVLCIPGWGESCCIFNKIKQLLNDYMEFNYIELPGFGNDILPEKDYYPKDYASYIHNELTNDIDLILAHSYGGKVALEYFLNYKKVPMVLLGPSIIKPKKSIFVRFKILKYKILKKLNLLNKSKEYGSVDYINAKGIMRKVFLNAINTYYDDLLKEIDSKVLLIYGNKDKQTPFKEGKKIKDHILSSNLKIIVGDHFVLSNNEVMVSKLILEFVRGL